MKEEIGIKHDQEKADWSLIPLKTVELVVRVLMFGAKKYSRDNWKKVTPKERYLSAALRHITEYQSGRRVDEESGLPTLAHAMCCLLFLLWLDDEVKNDLH